MAAAARDHASSWSAALEERCSREEDRLHTRLTKILQENITSLLETGNEADVVVPFTDANIPVHSCLIRARLPELWDSLQNEEVRLLVEQASTRDNFMQILRYIYSEDDISPVRLRVKELNATIFKLQHSGAPKSQEEPGRNHSSNIDQSEHTCLSGAMPDVQSQDFPNYPSQNQEQLSQSQTRSDQVNGNRNELENITTMEAIGDHEQSCSSAGMDVDVPVDCVQYIGTPQMYCQLGRDLLQMYHMTLASNVKVKVSDTTLLSHRCILYVRSSYFGAMLGGQWKESAARQINLERINTKAMQQAFVYIYGGIPDIKLDSSELIELITIADMYGLDGLKDIIGFNLKRVCHFFHKPCNECVPWVLSMLPTAHMFCLDELWEKGLRWCSRHVSRVWAAKQFASLPPDIQDSIILGTINEITNDTVIDVVLECDRLSGSLTSVRRSEPVIAMAAQLMDACTEHLKNNFVPITQTQKFLSLGKHMALSLDFLDDIFCRAIFTMPTTRACATYVRVWELRSESEQEICTWSEGFKQLIQHLDEKCEHFMRLYINQLIHTDDWKNLLSQDLQERIKEGAWYVCVGDGRRVRGAPKCLSYGSQNPATLDIVSGRRPPPPPGGGSKRSRSIPTRSTQNTSKANTGARPKAPKTLKTSSLPQPKRKKSESSSKPESCTFKAMKMAGDVETDSRDVKRIRPVVRKSSSEEPADVERNGSSRGQYSFPSVATVNTPLVTPSTEIEDCNVSENGEYVDVFLSPENEYVLVPPTIIESLEVEAIKFPPEQLIPSLMWQFFEPKK